MPVERDRCVSVCVMPALPLRREMLPPALRLRRLDRVLASWPCHGGFEGGLSAIRSSSTVSQKPVEKRPAIDNRQVKCTILLRAFLDSLFAAAQLQWPWGPGALAQGFSRAVVKKPAAMPPPERGGRGGRGGSCLRPSTSSLLP